MKIKFFGYPELAYFILTLVEQDYSSILAKSLVYLMKKLRALQNFDKSWNTYAKTMAINEEKPCLDFLTSKTQHPGFKNLIHHFFPSSSWRGSGSGRWCKIWCVSSDLIFRFSAWTSNLEHQNQISLFFLSAFFFLFRETKLAPG